MSRESIRTRVEAATPGAGYVVRAESSAMGDPYGGWLVWTDKRLYVGDIYHEADAAFIAAARTDIPLLLAVADAAAELLEQDPYTAYIEKGYGEAVARLRAALAALDVAP